MLGWVVENYFLAISFALEILDNRHIPHTLLFGILEDERKELEKNDRKSAD